MILVTGGTGMAGSFIVRELQQRGQAVRVLARPESAEIARAMGAEVATGDLTDHDSLRRAAAGVDGIVHAAYTVISDWSLSSDLDVAAMETLLSCWERGAFVYISSVDVYGYPQYVPINEAHPLDESYSNYGRGKIRSEALLQAAAQQRGRSDFTILRPPTLLGPHPRCLQRIFGEPIMSGQPVELPGKTEAEWSQFGDSWLDTRDLAWVVAEALQRPLGGPFNVAAEGFVWHDLVASLIRISGSSSQIVHKDRDEFEGDMSFYAQIWRYDGARLAERLGFRPAHQFQSTLREIAAISR